MRRKFLVACARPRFSGGDGWQCASAVTSYSVDGATNGYGHLWLLLLATPLYQSVQFACAKLGRITQSGFAEILREHYSRWVAIPASLILVSTFVPHISFGFASISSAVALLGATISPYTMF